MPPSAREEHDYLLTRRYRVWYGTDRKPVQDFRATPCFGRDFDDNLHLGSVVVHVPRSHAFGQIGSSWLKRRFKTLVLGKEDDRLRIVEVESLGESDFRDAIGKEIQHWKRRTALVFVHGYNVSFADAATRAAQIGFDLRVDGITAMFSWPSKGDTVPYWADEASVELAEDHFVKFIGLLAEVEGLEEVNILAHSMGNRLLLRTVHKLRDMRRAGALKAPIGHILLAAADLTAAKFRQYAEVYRELATRRVTSYAYDADKALMASRKLHDQPRVGLEPPLFVHPQVDTISVSELDLDLLGHSYIASAAPLLYDLVQLLHEHKAPPRTRLEPATGGTGAHWVLSA